MIICRALTRASIALLLLGISAALADEQRQNVNGAPGGPTTETPPAAAGLPCLPDDWAVIEADGLAGQTETPRVSQPSAQQPPAQQSSAQTTPATVTNGGRSYRAMHWEFQTAALCNACQLNGVHFLSRFDRFADVMFSPADPQVVAELKSVHGLRWSEVAEANVSPPPTIQPDGETARGAAEEVVRGGYSGLTGKGVIVAVLDTGIDFRHPDFITYDAAGRPTSRVRYLWDTLHNYNPSANIGSPAPASFPDGSSIGTLYSRDQLTADLRAAQPRIGGTDLNGHGTSCAGIAAGNGNALRQEYAGAAPNADLLVVQIGDANNKMVSEYLVGAIFEWLEKTAGPTPLVVSCSFGGFNCGHDGFTVVERQIDARFALDRPGRAILVAAGNDGAKRKHAAFTLAGAAAPGQVSWACPNATGMQIYIRANNPADFQVTPGSGVKLAKPAAALNALTGQTVISQAIPVGSGSLTVSSKSGRSCQADAYLLDAAAQFTSQNASIAVMLDTPGGSRNAITVGSYNWNNLLDVKGKTMSLRDSSATNRSITLGELSAYSTPGYTRIGDATKPEITAPGQWWSAPAVQNLASLDKMRDSSGRYRAFNGTSAATPYAAGVVALLLEKNPKLSCGEIRAALTKCATADDFTGSVPNNHWGFGKLDFDAVGRLLGGKYAVWVYQNVKGQWIKQDSRTLSTDDANQAKKYAAQVNATSGWKATSNLPAK